ncbi:MAG: ArsC family (seleno)protein [Desulfobulbus sp.]|nr:ArsC family (seleno)protein [Desulfobulbus sp.]
MKAQAVLEQQHIPMEQRVDARKEALAGEAAWQLLSTANEILVAKGKKVQTFNPRVDAKEVILAAALGRTGTLRAPTLRIGDQFMVGFGEGLYRTFIG